jgi:hypothetical protein
VSVSFFPQFLKLSGLALEREFPVPGSLSDEELAEFESSLSMLDEQHLAFAITLLAHHAPLRLLPHLSWALADSRTGVWTAAERSVLLFPDSVMTPETLTAIREAVQKRPGSTKNSWLLQTKTKTDSR